MRKKIMSYITSKINKRITLERPILTQDSIGDTHVTWVYSSRAWAQIEPLKTQEKFINSGLHHYSEFKITLRFNSEILPTWRIIYNQHTLKIKSLTNWGEENKLLQIIASTEI